MTSEIREHNGHRIELRSPPTAAAGAAAGAASGEAPAPAELLVDGKAIPYGMFRDGQFFLHDYAYDWTDDLLELAERYVDYRDKVGR